MNSGTVGEGLSVGFEVLVVVGLGVNVVCEVGIGVEVGKGVGVVVAVAPRFTVIECVLCE